MESLGKRRIPLLILLLLIFVSKAHAEKIPDNVAIRIIVSEAADQGLKGTICIGEVLTVYFLVKLKSGLAMPSIRNTPPRLF